MSHEACGSGWTNRNEALMETVVKQARTTRHPSLVACGANMNPRDFTKGAWFKDRSMFIEAPGQFPIADPMVQMAKRLRERFMTSLSVMEVAEDIGSRLHKAVTFSG